MTTKEQLKQVIYEQREFTNGKWVEREIDQSLIDCPEILVLTGIRRSGKSTLLQQIRHAQAEQDYYLSFDDDRLLHFTSDDFQTLCEVFAEEFGMQKTFYLDEIQLIDGWERFVGRLYRQGNKVFVTGSNAKMLSRELGTLLTGRHVSKEVFPFSLSEFMKMRNVECTTEKTYTTEGKAIMLNVQNEYLRMGGFPQFVSSGNGQYLQSLYNDILYRDIIVRHGIASDKTLKETMFYLISNFTHLLTYNSVAKAVGIKSSETIHDYIGYMEESYLVSTLSKFNNKVGEQVRSAKKAYFIDNGLIRQIGFRFSDNDGAQLENAVFVELRRRGGKLFYFNENGECDFIVRRGGCVVEAYQVSVSIFDDKTRQREVAGVSAAMKEFSLSEGYIITKDEAEDIKTEDGGTIHVLPFYRWSRSGMAR